MKRVLFFIVVVTITGYSWAQRDTSAIIRQGLKYIETKNYVKAYSIFSKAANEGNSYAQCCMGVLYNNGYGVKQDKTIALQWFRKSAEQGNYYGFYNLGSMYDNGEGVSQDYEQAVYWFKKAAEMGYDEAQNQLGECYYYGNGVSQN